MTWQIGLLKLKKCALLVKEDDFFYQKETLSSGEADAAVDWGLGLLWFRVCYV